MRLFTMGAMSISVAGLPFVSLTQSARLYAALLHSSLSDNRQFVLDSSELPPESAKTRKRTPASQSTEPEIIQL
jgi:hypothetical protein